MIKLENYNKTYSIQKDKIVIHDLSCFCIKHILECGQVFRFERITKMEINGVKYAYKIISLNKIAVILEFETYAEILTTDVNYFVNYFDLDTNYNNIKEKLSKDEILCEAINYGYGIRILKQHPLETIVSFIISANNNIKRIQNSLNKISCLFGSKCKSSVNGESFEFYAFPNLEQLSKIKEEEFRNCGTGFRDKYLVDTIKKLQEGYLNNFEKLLASEALSKLIKLKGIGPKVADCIMLFGYYNMCVFPVDTWIKKVYNSYYSKNIEEDVSVIRKNLTNKFGVLSGYAQQYLFYYKREMEKRW